MQEDLTELWVQCATLYCDSQTETILGLAQLNTAIHVTSAYAELLGPERFEHWAQTELGSFMAIESILDTAWTGATALEERLRHQGGRDERIRENNARELKQFALSLLHHMDDQAQLSGSGNEVVFTPDMARQAAVRHGRETVIDWIVDKITTDMKDLQRKFVSSPIMDTFTRDTTDAIIAVAMTKAEIFKTFRNAPDVDTVIDAVAKWASIPRYKSGPYRADMGTRYVTGAAHNFLTQ